MFLLKELYTVNNIININKYFREYFNSDYSHIRESRNPNHEWYSTTIHQY